MWIGIRFDTTTGQFLWSNGNGEGLDFTSNWWYKHGAINEPDRDGNCVVSMQQGKKFLLYDRDCSAATKYICEKV